jgi:hypothetical protein
MWRWTGALISILALGAVAEAGEIELKNGSRLDGELANDVLLISTGTDLVEVDPVQVSVLTGEEVRLVDGRVVRGTIVGGRVKVRTSLGELALEVDRLRAFRREPGAPDPPPPAASPSPAPAPAPPPAPASPPAPGPTAPSAATRVPTPPAPSESATASPPPAAPAPPGGGTTGAGGETRSETPTTIPDAARGVGRAVGDAADLLHDGLKAFGLSIWEAMKGVGRAVQGAF